MSGKILRNFGIGFSIAAGAVGAGCAQHAAVIDTVAEIAELMQPQETKWAEDSFEARTEKEFRKHDPWVVQAFKTSQDSTAPVRIGKYAGAFENKKRDIDIHAHNMGLYSRAKEALFLYPEEGTFNAVDHEAFHAFRDLVKKGKIKCSAPAGKDISVYCEAQRSLPAFKDLEKKAEVWAKTKKEYARLKVLMEQHEFYYGSVEESELMYKLYGSKKIIEGDFLYSEGNWAFLVLQNQRGIARDKLIGKRNAFQPSVEELEDFYSTLNKNVDEVERQVAFFRESALELAEGCLSKEKYKRLREDFSEVQGFLPICDMSLQLKGLLLSERRQIYEEILSEEELLARAFDGLASIYLGPAEVNMIPITPESIALFEQYKDEGGNPVFRKLIERGKVALQMQEDGVNPEEIKKQLEYAESFTYRNVTYDWKNIDFRLVEQIPLLDRD